MSEIGLMMAILKDNPKKAKALEWKMLYRCQWPTEIYDLINECVKTCTPRVSKINKKI